MTKKYRNYKKPISNSYWIYGRHAVTSALSNKKRRILRLLVTKNTSDEIEFKYSGRIEILDQKELEKILPPNAVHQGVAAEVCILPDVTIEDIDSNANLLVILDQVNDPQNVGAILRSAAAFGANAVIMPRDNSVSESGALAKAASGALEIVPIAKVTNLASAIKHFKHNGFWIIGLDGEAKTDLSKAPKYEKTAIVLGAEGKGLRRLTSENCDLLVRLPISDKVESLNVSNATAVALYHLTRK